VRKRHRSNSWTGQRALGLSVVRELQGEPRLTARFAFYSWDSTARADLSDVSRKEIYSRAMKIVMSAAATIVLLLTVESISGQSNPGQTAPPTVSAIQTERAAIYVTATTKNGMTIRDLKPEDLTINEDKVPAKIEKVACGKPEPLFVGVLVDVSGSRGLDSHLLSHYDDLEKFLDMLIAVGDGTYILAYGKEIYQVSELVTDRADIAEAFDKLRKHKPYGPTALYDAIKDAAEVKIKGRSGHRILIVMGDWEDNVSHVPHDAAGKAAQRNSTTIYAIVDSDSGAENKKARKRAAEMATEVAQDTGGLAYVVKEKADFEKALQAIGAAVTGSCRVEYTTTKNAETSKGAKLHVEGSLKDVSILYPRVRFSSTN
jgi:VWFA-related protein